jgi:hypothetical protein
MKDAAVVMQVNLILTPVQMGDRGLHASSGPW